jgi:hypothetical protein
LVQNDPAIVEKQRRREHVEPTRPLRMAVQ